MECYVYLVGRIQKFNEDIPVWECIGVYDSKNEALNNCTTNLDFVAPIVIDSISDCLLDTIRHKNKTSDKKVTI